MKTFVDTNIFMYAVGRSHPLRPSAELVIQKVGTGELDATTNTEVLQELLFVYSRRGQRSVGISVVQDILDLIPDVLSVAKPDLVMAALLMGQYTHLNSRDAVHLATMRTNGIESIITADKHFDGIDGVTRVDPSEFQPL
jgi:predicted nucleic acid-binding protein